MNSTNKIYNLNDFDNYRTHCPFCNKKLILNEYRHLSRISIRKEHENFILEYDTPGSFSAQIRLIIQNIQLNIFNNTVIYNLQKENFIVVENYDSALKNNIVIISKNCYCENNYSIDLDSIYLNSINLEMFSVNLRNESFRIRKGDTDLEIVNYFLTNKTGIRFRKNFHDQGFSSVSDEEIISFIKFPYNDKEAILQKVKFLTTFI